MTPFVLQKMVTGAQAKSKIPFVCSYVTLTFPYFICYYVVYRTADDFGMSNIGFDK